METDITVALFDLDGTLIDTEGQYSRFWGAMGRKYRPDLPDFANIIKGTTLTQIYDRYIPDMEDREAITEQLNAYEEQMRYDFYPGALDFLHDLREHGVKCAIVTSSNVPKMQSVIRQMPDFYNLFDRVLTSEDFSASKPAPDCYLLGAQVFGAEKEQCVVFEDALTGLEAGMRSGIFTFGLATTNPADVISSQCHYVLPSWEGFCYQKMAGIVRSTGHSHQ